MPSSYALSPETSLETKYGISNHEIYVSRAALIHSSLTVGKANLFHGVVQLTKKGGLADAILRVLRVHAFVDFSDPNCIQHTSLFQTLDQSEQASASFFLGMAFQKMFAHRYLNYPWLVHHSYLVASGRATRPDNGSSTPDLIGFDKIENTFGLFEAKGRSGRYDAKAMSKAKKQVGQPIQVDNKDPTIRIAGQVYLNQNDELEYYWKDPPEKEGEPIALNTSIEMWRRYYWPAFCLYDWIGESPDRGLLGFDVNLSSGLMDLKGMLKGNPTLIQVNEILQVIQKEAIKKVIDYNPPFYFGPDGIIITEKNND